jgi:hypothetical protein
VLVPAPALDDELAGLNTLLQALPRLLPAWLRELRRVDSFDPDPLATAAQRVAVDCRAALCGGYDTCRGYGQDREDRSDCQDLLLVRECYPTAVCLCVRRPAGVQSQP